MGCCVSRKAGKNVTVKSNPQPLAGNKVNALFNSALPTSENKSAPSEAEKISSTTEDKSRESGDNATASLNTLTSTNSNSCPIRPNGDGCDNVLQFDITRDQENSQKIGQTGILRAREIPIPQPPQSFPYYITAPIEMLHKKLYENLFQLLENEGLFFTSKKGRVHPPLEFKAPNELKKEIDFTLGETGVSHEALLEIVRVVMRFQPRTGHPFYMEQRVAGLEPYSCVSDIIATCINSNNMLYIVSNVLNLLELELIQAICKLVGYNRVGSGDGAITNDSVLANAYAMKIAVQQKLPFIKHKGLSGFKRPAIFVSTASVHIHSKCAIFQGFGTDSIIPVSTDELGRMNVEDLEEKIKECLLKRDSIPCMVVGTAGTNILRALDPFDRIADVCKRFRLWFHVDGTWGGGALLFSETLRDKLIGLESSDSFVWSQNCNLSCTCTCLVTPPRHKDKLAQYKNIGDETGNAFTTTPLYDPEYENRLNCMVSSGSRAEMLKFWLMWKAKGTNDLGRHVDYIHKNAMHCLHEMRKRGGFNPILDRFEGTNVCFVYVPIAYRNLIPNSDAYCEKVSKLTLKLARFLLVQGIVSLSYSELPKRPTFFILGLHNSAVSRQDIQYVLDQIEYFGEKFSSAQ